MKTLKLSLCTAVALSAMVAGAKADMLSDVKVEMKNIDAAMAGAMIGNNAVFNNTDNVHAIMIRPSADVPAADPTTIVWAGRIRMAGAIAHEVSNASASNAAGANQTTTVTPGNYAYDILGRANLKVVGSTETDMGQFGVNIELRANANDGWFNYNGAQSAVQTDGWYGWWKGGSATLSAGMGNSIQKGTLAKSSYTYDAKSTAQYTSNWGTIIQSPRTQNALNTSSADNPLQFALAYNAGPIGMAVSIEDAGQLTNGNTPSAVGFAGKATYSEGAFGLDLQGGYWLAPQNAVNTNAAWGVAIGAGAKFDMLTIGGAIGTGNIGAYGGGANSGMGAATNKAMQANANYTASSVYALAALSPTFNLEAGIIHDWGTDVNDGYNGATNYNLGAYWNPKKQFTAGIEGVYQTGGIGDGSYVADIVTIFRF